MLEINLAENFQMELLHPRFSGWSDQVAASDAQSRPYQRPPSHGAVARAAAIRQILPLTQAVTPARNKTGPAQLLDMVKGRSKAVSEQWLAAHPKDWSKQIEAVAMDGPSGFKTAAAEELPDATPVMDPFHAVRLAGDALDACRRRVQQEITGDRGLKGDPLAAPCTGASLLTDKQLVRVNAVFAVEEHVQVEPTRGIHQRIVAPTANPTSRRPRP